MKWSPGCGCCGETDPCSVVTVTNEQNGTSDGLEQYYTLGSPSAPEKAALASDKILAAGMGLLSVDDVITDEDNWTWKILLNGKWSNPAKYRIISQASYSAGLGDHVFGEVEILAPAAGELFHSADWPVRLAIGQSVGGVETIFDEAFLQNTQSPNSYGPIYPYPATVVLTRSLTYDEFELAGPMPIDSDHTNYSWIWNAFDIYAYGGQDAVIIQEYGSGNGEVSGRKFKDGDILRLVDYDNRLNASGWVIYRQVDASLNPTFTAAGDGLKNGDYLYPSAAGTVVNAADALDFITVALGESIEVTDDTQITTTAGWTLDVSFDPAASTAHLSLTVANTTKTLIGFGAADGVIARGGDVTSTPTGGAKVGVSCITQTGDDPKLSFGGGTHNKTMTLDTPSCPYVMKGMPHCPCADDIEKDIWVSHSSSFDFATDLPNFFDQGGWYYTLFSASNSAIYRKGSINSSGAVSPQSLCAFEFRRHANYLAPAGAYGKTIQRGAEIVEYVWFDVYRSTYEPFNIPDPLRFDDDRLILKANGAISMSVYEACSAPGSGTAYNMTGLEPLELGSNRWGAACALGGAWRNVYFANTIVARILNAETPSSVSGFDCANFSVQFTYEYVSNLIIDPETHFDGETSTWSQA